MLDGNERNRLKAMSGVFLALLVGLVLWYVYHEKTSNAYISVPIEFDSSLIDIGHVSLDLKSALLFKSNNDIIGYIYFTNVVNGTASYTIALFKKQNSGLIPLTTQKGKINMLHSQNIRCGEFSFIWIYPTLLNIVDAVQYAAVIPIVDIPKLKNGNIGFIKWSKITLSDA